jgi:type IV pilus assembly protein PilC
MVLAKRLSLLLDAGVPLLTALSMMREQARGRAAVFVLDTLTDSVSRGQPLSSGLAALSEFGPLSVRLVAVGEESGTLPEHLRRLAQMLKSRQQLKRKVVGALIYPTLIVLATIFITGLLTLYVFPKILPIFKGFHAALPLPTRVLIGLSGFLGSYGLLILLFLILLSFFFFLLLRLPSYRLAVSRAVLRVPVVGSLLRYYALANFCRTLSTLLASEVGVVRAVESAALASGAAYRESSLAAALRVSRGERVATALALDPLLFPPLLTQMLSVGESTGGLPDSLAYCAGYYEEELDELSRSVAALIEPALMMCMGIIVGFVAVAIITPIYAITQNLNP